MVQCYFARCTNIIYTDLGQSNSALRSYENSMKKLLFLLLVLTLPSSSFAEDKYLGAASCASSNCHGNVNPQKTTNVLQNEYITWFKHGAHAKAWSTLRNKDSKQIAKHLGIKSAENSELCLSCHSTFVKNELRGPKFRLQDGVSCESCHGPASGWIKSHKEKGASNKQNIAKGLKEIVPYKKRVDLCLSCHLGSDDKFVNHKLIGAGHPRLTFELDTFSLIQPNHWNVDADYIKRKSTYISAKAWLIGQIVRASKMIEALKSEKRSSYKGLPEFSNYSCYSCHHSLKEDQWKERDYAGKPGEMRLNLSSLLISNLAVKVIKGEGELSAEVDKLIEEFNPQNLDNIQKLLDGEILELAEKTTFDKSLSQKLLKEFVRYGVETSHLSFEMAEQVLMAVSALVATISPEKALYQEKVDKLYEVASDEEGFDAGAFREAMGELLGDLKA